MRGETEKVFKELSILMLLSVVTGSLVILMFFQALIPLLSFFAGALLAYINFSTLRKEGQELLFKVYKNVIACMERPYQRERTLFLIRVYLRLLALGIIFYFLIAKLSFHPVFLLLGFSWVYLQIFVVMFRFWLKKRESF